MEAGAKTTIPPLKTMMNDAGDDAETVCSLTNFHCSAADVGAVAVLVVVVKVAGVVVVAVGVAESLVGCDGDDGVASDVVAVVDYCLSLTMPAGSVSYVYYWTSRQLERKVAPVE